MVPRPYASQTTALSLRSPSDQKKRTSVRRSSKDRTHKTSTPPRIVRDHIDESLSSSSSTSPTSPVRIPSRHNSQGLPDRSQPVANKSPRSSTVVSGKNGPKLSKAYTVPSVDTLLASTAIQPRRPPRPRKSQRLPECDHVAEFSKLLLDDLGTREEGVSGSLGNPQFDLIFGSPNDADEGETVAGGECAGQGHMSIHSISSESMPSLENDDDSATTASLSEAPTPSLVVRRTLPGKRTPQFSTSEELPPNDHPLKTPVLQPSSPTPGPLSNLNLAAKPRASSTIRSNLTASLRALKSAAQTVSSIKLTPPLNRPDDFLTRSIFDISPTLTDDKRPPPLSSPPSPALRRYLNPPRTTGTSASTSLTPSDIATYYDPPSSKSSSVSSSIQLQTYLPPTHRSATASSPPIFPATAPTVEAQLTPFTGPNLARQREPRENSDFLRVLVCEMEMRRKGKLRDDVEGRACVWLPPRNMRVREGEGKEGRNGSERLESWTL